MTIQVKGVLEIDHDRGVIYFHPEDEQVWPLGSTMLRICSLPRPLPAVADVLEQNSMYDITFGYGVSWR